MIVDGLDEKKISNGISGYLRQEFRELEMLNEITRLRYEGLLPSTVVGDTRRQLIYNYRQWKGQEFVPDSIPEKLRWSAEDLFAVEEPSKEENYITLDQLKKLQKDDKKKTSTNSKQKSQLKQAHFIPAQGSQSLPAVNKQSSITNTPKIKRKRANQSVVQNDKVSASEIDTNALKRKRTSYSSAVNNADREPLRGLIWNQDTYSCAYDSLFTIIKCLYDQSNAQQKLQLKQTNIFLHALCEQIDNVNNNSCTFEEGRDLVRQLLHEAQPDEFTIRGSTGTDICELVKSVLQNSLIKSAWTPYCPHCKEYTRSVPESNPLLCLYRTDLPTSLGRSRLTTTETSTWIQHAMVSTRNHKCVTCRSNLIYNLNIDNDPTFLVLSWSDPGIKVKWEHKILFNEQQYRLCGLIYLGHFHFTARIVQNDGSVWYHDGIRTGNKCAYEGHIDSMTTRKLSNAHNKACIMAIYIQIES